MIRHFSAYSFVAGSMFGVLLASAWFFNEEISFTPTSLSMLTTRTEKSPAPESGAISIGNQPAGLEVVVDSITVPPPGVWVAVREVNGDDLGNVLGASFVSGPRSNVSIQLLRETELGRQYAVQLYRDDGTGTFDLATDSVYVDFDTGARVVAYFKTIE